MCIHYIAPRMPYDNAPRTHLAFEGCSSVKLQHPLFCLQQRIVNPPTCLRQLKNGIYVLYLGCLCIWQGVMPVLNQHLRVYQGPQILTSYPPYIVLLHVYN